MKLTWTLKELNAEIRLARKELRQQYGKRLVTVGNEDCRLSVRHEDNWGALQIPYIVRDVIFSEDGSARDGMRNAVYLVAI